MNNVNNVNLTEEQEANIRAWLKNLRSGEYKQARGVLKNDKGGFCCLGILAQTCEIPFTENCVPTALTDEDLLYDTKAHYLDVEDGQSHYKLLPYLLFTSLTGLGDKWQDYFANMNDNGNSFETIADHIEKIAF